MCETKLNTHTQRLLYISKMQRYTVGSEYWTKLWSWTRNGLAFGPLEVCLLRTNPVWLDASLVFKWSKVVTEWSVIQMPFEFKTVIQMVVWILNYHFNSRHLNNRQVKICYSDVSVIHMLLFRSLLYLPFCLWDRQT